MKWGVLHPGTFITLQFQGYQNNINDVAGAPSGYQFLCGGRNDRNLARANK
jgi:hypothetical protein